MTTTLTPLDQLKDGQDRSLAEVRLLLPKQPKEWSAWMQNEGIKLPPMRDKELMDELADDPRWKRLRHCDSAIGENDVRQVEFHHLRPSARRLAHRTNLLPLCSLWDGDGCHVWAHRKRNWPEVLRLKLEFDREGTDLLALTLIAGFWID